MRKQINVSIGIIVIVSLVSVHCAYGAHKQLEKAYQKEWCADHQGHTEFKLSDKTRVDCITQTNAIEFDFGPKFYEALGQSLWYALNTGKKAGVVLILESLDENKYWIRLNSIIQYFKLPIDTWKIENF